MKIFHGLAVLGTGARLMGLDSARVPAARGTGPLMPRLVPGVESGTGPLAFEGPETNE